MTDLRADLPQLLPKAVAWVEQREAEIFISGVALDENEISVARLVGVDRPEQIRVEFFDDDVQMPSDLELRRVGLEAGIFGPTVDGLTLGHSICFRRSAFSIQLLAHECRHVHQYEQAGSAESFLKNYILQIDEFDYENAPYEVDARAYEIEG